MSNDHAAQRYSWRRRLQTAPGSNVIGRNDACSLQQYTGPRLLAYAGGLFNCMGGQLLCIDPLTGTLAYSNAGHPGLLLVRADGYIEELALGGLPLGIRAQVQYDGGSTLMRAGDVLLAYTDGITERQRGEAMFGEERLTELLKSLAGRPIAEIHGALDAKLDAFARDTRPPDDLTYIILRRGD